MNKKRGQVLKYNLYLLYSLSCQDLYALNTPVLSTTSHLVATPDRIFTTMMKTGKSSYQSLRLSLNVSTGYATAIA